MRTKLKIAQCPKKGTIKHNKYEAHHESRVFENRQTSPRRAKESANATRAQKMMYVLFIAKIGQASDTTIL